MTFMERKTTVERNKTMVPEGETKMEDDNGIGGASLTSTLSLEIQESGQAPEKDQERRSVLQTLLPATKANLYLFFFMLQNFYCRLDKMSKTAFTIVVNWGPCFL